MGKAKRLERVQQLFDRGVTLSFGEGDDVIRFWVAKPNTFERDEALKDARGCRARAVLAFDRDEQMHNEIDFILGELTREEIVEGLLRQKGPEHLTKASNEVRTRKDWQERLEAIDRQGLDGATEEELAAVQAASDEFEKAVLTEAARLDREHRAELDELTLDALGEEFRKMQREQAGVEAFLAGRRRTQIFFGLRECEAVPRDPDDPGAGWDHTACGAHREQVLTDRASVLELPDVLVEQAGAYFDGMLTEESAGNWGAPSASSGSSGQRSKQEESTPSTPKEM